MNKKIFLTQATESVSSGCDCCEDYDQEVYYDSKGIRHDDVVDAISAELAIVGYELEFVQA